ncbi:hypothetical protein QQF64_031750 [Cirrhinus molitorella]|uniref:Uncharacterized protein n=1 Tax=Cirrhinus molitorella TaxID=172907 RepID=A0ABR3MY01_9TELE
MTMEGAKEETGGTRVDQTEGGARETTGGTWSRRRQVRSRWPTVEPTEGGVMVEEGLMTPGGQPKEVEQVEVQPEVEMGEPMRQVDVEDLEGQGGVQGSGDQGRGGDPKVRYGAGATVDLGGVGGREELNGAGGMERGDAAGGAES